MIESWRCAFGAATIALIHADHIHADGQSFVGNPDRVTGVTGAFEPVHDDDRKRILPLALPVAMAEEPYSGLDFNETFFRSGQRDLAMQKETGEGLHMTASQAAAWHKLTRFDFSLRSPHKLILNSLGVPRC